MDVKCRFKQQLLNARQMSERMLADFKTPQQWTHQVQPDANHALWFAGHMENVDNFFISVLAPDQIKDLGPWHKLFGVGSTPLPDAAQYPPHEEVLVVMRERRGALMAILDSLTEDDFARKTPAGSPDFLSDLASVFETAIWHEGIHTGQLSLARRAIGCAPVMG